MAGISKTAVVLHDAVIVRLLNNNTSHASCLQSFFHLCLVGHAVSFGDGLHLEAMEMSVSLYNGNCLRVESS